MAKICINCGHEACPSCLDWCDRILYQPSDQGNHIEADDENDYPVPCCGGMCSYPEDATPVRSLKITFDNQGNVIKTKRNGKKNNRNQENGHRPAHS